MKRLLFAFVSVLAAVGFGDVVKGIAYDASLGTKGVGDLYRPDGWTAETPVVLQIHGGGWTSQDRSSWAGVAKYFTEKLGYACYNIDYRLAPEHPWPAGGEDCLKAANFLLSPDFATTYGLKPNRIWICGGSAGGHLALWTGLSLPAEKVAGIISISGIGNPRPDAAAHAGRYKAVFGNREPTEADFAAIDPRNLLKAGAIPKILQTHVDHDTAVPIESARDFATRITELGGTSTFVAYKKADITTTGGHCIWVPKSNPHELIPAVKTAIEAFLPQCGEISLTNRFGSVRIETLGARVTSYVPAGGEETLALLASGTGGIPLCWPWFQFNGPQGEASPKHGVARYREFEVVSVANGPDASEAVLRLRSDAQTRRDFPHDFELTLAVRLDRNLNLALTGRNTGKDAFSVTEAFHPYLLRPAIPLLMDTGNGRYRTWEPDRTSHTKTQGLGPEDWRKFVCVENGTFKKEEAYTLAPGEAHTLTRTIGPMQRVNPDEPLDTSIQAEIDAVSKAGGGRVTVKAGRHLVGQIELRDNVELHLEKGAVLEGSRCPADYRRLRIPCTEGDLISVVMAENVSNVSITGEGEIFGNGGAWPQPVSWANNQEGYRPRGLVFINCRNVRLEDFRLHDAACWGVVVKECDGFVARRVRIDTHCNANNDGFDIEAKNVLIEDCDVDSSDDAYCLKSNNPAYTMENVTIRRCIARSNCNAYKIGTASHGIVRNIRVENCCVEAPRRTFLSRVKSEAMTEPGQDWFLKHRTRRYCCGPDTPCGQSAVAIECVDGGEVSNVTVDGLEATGVMAPLFVRGGTRTGRACGTPPGKLHILKDIVLRNITATADSYNPSSITGVDGCRAQNVTLENVKLILKPGDVDPPKDPVPERAGAYPEADMLGVTPARGLYIRKVDNLTLKNVTFETSGTAKRENLVQE